MESVEAVSVSNDEEVIRIRKDKVAKFFKERTNFVVYLLLGLVVILSVWIRTRNLPGLRDVTTGGWTLGPDLDPFLFLRWAQYIVEHGQLMAVDMMRYVPLGFNTRGEMLLLSYMIAWFHKLVAALGISDSVTQSAVYFPAAMFGLTVIAFFFLVRTICRESLGEKNANIVAVIASLFLAIMPPLLPRTIAGIPEKESVGFLFMFLAFYFFMKGWKTKKRNTQVILGLLAAVSTAGMALVWGGFAYILVVLSLVIFIAFLLGQMELDKIILSMIWIIPAYILMSLVSSRYSLMNLMTSTTTLLPLLVIALPLVQRILFSTSLKRYVSTGRISKVPRPITTLLIVIVGGAILSVIFLGPDFLTDKARDFVKPLINPVNDRFGITVAENRQPFYAEWVREFGPVAPLTNSLPVYFWLFIIGAVYLYHEMLHMFSKKERRIMTAGFAIFLFAIIFSRYSAESVFNGTNLASLAFYLLGAVVLVVTFGIYYYRHYVSESDSLKKIDIGMIFLFSLFFFSVVSARGSVRTIMVLVPSVAIIVPYLLVKFGSKTVREIKHE